LLRLYEARVAFLGIFSDKKASVVMLLVLKTN
jgi:hypothetical protein